MDPGSLAANDKIDDDVLKQSGVIRTRSLREMLEFARALSIRPHAEGRQHRDHHGRRRLRRAPSDAVVENGLWPRQLGCRIVPRAQRS